MRRWGQRPQVLDLGRVPPVEFIHCEKSRKSCRRQRTAALRLGAVAFVETRSDVADDGGKGNSSALPGGRLFAGLKDF
jgi:hypothetical protein